MCICFLTVISSVRREAEDGSNRRDANSPLHYLLGYWGSLHALSTDRQLPAGGVTPAAAALCRDTTLFPLAAWLHLAFFFIAEHRMTMQLIHCTRTGVRTAIMPSQGTKWECRSVKPPLLPTRLLGLEREGCAVLNIHAYTLSFNTEAFKYFRSELV